MANSAARWWVYVLRCGDGSLYTGITTDLPRRLRQHNAGTASRYTRSRRPVEAVFRQRCPDRSAALRREAEIKSLSRQAKQELIAKRARGAEKKGRRQKHGD